MDLVNSLGQYWLKMIDFRPMPEILGVRVDAIKPAELEGKLRGFLIEGGLHKVFTPNAEMVLKSHRDGAFKDVLNRGDLNLADGVSLVFASAFLSFFDKKCVHRIEQRITGVDTLDLLCRIAAEDGRKVFLLGADAGVGEKAAEVLKKRYAGLQIRANDGGMIQHHPQPILTEEGRALAGWIVEPGVLEDVRGFEPDILAVALGHGKQEHFICSALGSMPSIKIAIGVGGALDYLSGNLARAPKWMRRIGFEWLYRLVKQPKRVGRIVDAVIVFPLVVIWDRIKALW